MRRYHHIGIPTSQPRQGERHIERLKSFIVGHENSEYGVEWMRFEADAPIPELVRQVAHVAFEVSNLASELVGREILIAPNSPSEGVRVAFIVENGAPIELLEFTDPNHPDRREVTTWIGEKSRLGIKVAPINFAALSSWSKLPKNLGLRTAAKSLCLRLRNFRRSVVNIVYVVDRLL